MGFASALAEGPSQHTESGDPRRASWQKFSGCRV